MDQINLYIIELINAINNENLNDTKKYVDLLNSYPEEVGITTILTDTLNVHGYPYPLSNVSFDYILDNLKYLNNADLVKLQRKKLRLIKNNNPQEITDFILEQLKFPTYRVFDKELMQNLLQLIPYVKDKAKISEILSMIKETFLKEEN